MLKIALARRRRRNLSFQMATLVAVRRKFRLRLLALLCLLLQQVGEEEERFRSIRRCERNAGWWEMVWSTYDNSRFKKTFRVTRQTFCYILENIRQDITKDQLTEMPISPECRLAICLYRLGRGDYLYTIAELFGVGLATIHVIVKEVCEAIVKNLWKKAVTNHFPTSEQDFTEVMVDMNQLWQFPWCWGAIDGCHIPIQCPPGGEEACKEYHNFKNFFSIVMMAIVDAAARFMWVSVGFPGNSHDSIIFQSTQLWSDITEKKVIPEISQNFQGTDIYPMILGDSAFPFRIWLMKPYSNAVLSAEQHYFNYRLSRARMVSERAFGQLKSRWRVLYRKSSCQPDAVKCIALACVVLHNVCIDVSDSLPSQLDLTEHPAQHGRRSRKEVRELLMMRNCTMKKDKSHHAEEIRKALLDKFWEEKEEQ